MTFKTHNKYHKQIFYICCFYFLLQCLVTLIMTLGGVYKFVQNCQSIMCFSYYKTKSLLWPVQLLDHAYFSTFEFFIMFVFLVSFTNYMQFQRDTIQAASSFAQRNYLPVRLQEQMLDSLCLKYRTDSEGLQQQEILDSLPKAIRSSISHFLFYPLVDNVYLFRGVSHDLLFQLVILFNFISQSLVVFGWGINWPFLVFPLSDAKGVL